MLEKQCKCAITREAQLAFSRTDFIQTGHSLAKTLKRNNTTQLGRGAAATRLDSVPEEWAVVAQVHKLLLSILCMDLIKIHCIPLCVNLLKLERQEDGRNKRERVMTLREVP